jgi:hypothetical protein
MNQSIISNVLAVTPLLAWYNFVSLSSRCVHIAAKGLRR